MYYGGRGVNIQYRISNDQYRTIENLVVGTPFMASVDQAVRIVIENIHRKSDAVNRVPTPGDHCLPENERKHVVGTSFMTSAVPGDG